MSSFHEIQFPTNLSYGSKGGPRFSTAITKKVSGAIEPVARWGYPLHVFNVKYGLRKYEDLVQLRDFFIRRLGPAHGFRYKDPLDFSTKTPYVLSEYLTGSAPAFSDVIIGVGDGTTKVFQLAKKYSDAVVTRTRNITKPILGTVKSGVNGVEKTISTDWTVDTTTGLVTYQVAPTNGHNVTAGFEFDVPVKFDESLDEGFILDLADVDAGDIPDILLMEELGGGIVADEFFYGGSADVSFGASISVSPNSGRFIRLTPTTAGLSVRLPDTTDLEDGGPWFAFYNAGSQTVGITTNTGTLVLNLAASTGVEMYLGTFSGVRTWQGI